MFRNYKNANYSLKQRLQRLSLHVLSHHKLHISLLTCPLLRMIRLVWEATDKGPENEF